MFNKRLKELRKQKGLTQKELAKRSGLSVGMISQMESGQRKIMTDSFFKALNAMHITILEYFSVYSLEDRKILNQVLHIIKGKNLFIKNYLLTVLQTLMLIHNTNFDIKKTDLVFPLEQATTRLEITLRRVEKKINQIKKVK